MRIFPRLVYLPLIISPMLCTSIVTAQTGGSQLQVIRSAVERDYALLEALYKHLHANPELSFQEQQTAARMAQELRATGFKVTENFGGHGVVGVLKNGDGPTVMLRADMDALPVQEATGLPYASTAKAIDDGGNEVHVMHACGHDIHMTSLIGALRVLKQMQPQWDGTLVAILQPAEERGGGAIAMLEAGLYQKFPQPDHVVALHVSASMPAGKVGIRDGYAMANVDMMDIVVKGRGGHGAYPHTTKDPVVLAAQLIMALQTIVSREISPLEPAVVTVGAIHGGTKHNVISDEVHLQLTLRSYTDAVRQQTIAAIRRMAAKLAEAAGLPEELLPEVKLADQFTPAVYNDPALAERLRAAFVDALSAGNTLPVEPVMAGEDFSRYGRTEAKVPISLYWLGAVDPERYRRSQEQGIPLPSLHSNKFAPLPEPTIKTGVISLTSAALELLGK